MADLRTPLSRARGLGSAKDGTSHFWHQRITALLMIPLVLWAGFSLALRPMDHASLLAWVQQPLVTIGLLLLIINVFYHAKMGLQTVIEDYVSTHGRRTMMLLVANLACLLFGILGVVSVLKLALGN